jgi:YidC/Oxa1 family membrane protein insertase
LLVLSRSLFISPSPRSCSQPLDPQPVCRIDGTPALGWDDTLAFLVLPLFLVVSQYASVALMQPKTAGDDPQQQQSNAILKVLPLMIGWFALSVPSALSVYWATNNIVTTATSLWIKNSLAANPPPVVATSAGSSSSSNSSGASASSIFAPPREKPSGFAPSTTDGVKPITAIDAEIISDDDDDDDAAAAVGGSSDKKKRRKNKKKKN